MEQKNYSHFMLQATFLGKYKSANEWMIPLEIFFRSSTFYLIFNEVASAASFSPPCILFSPAV